MEARRNSKEGRVEEDESMSGLRKDKNRGAVVDLGRERESAERQQRDKRGQRSEKGTAGKKKGTG